ncbi:MAG: YceI family protein [Terriglobales bacterium]
MVTKNISLALLFALAATPAALADSWKIDPKHSAASFSVRHMMVSTVRGQFSNVTGTVNFDPKNVAASKVDAVIDVTTVNTNEADRDKHLKSPDFFDVEKFPTMKFVSKGVVVESVGKFKLVGDLTLHGVTKEVTLAVEGPSQAIKDQKGNERSGATATGKINRNDFGIKFNKAMDNGGVMVGDQIPITIDIELIKSTKG